MSVAWTNPSFRNQTLHIFSQFNFTMRTQSLPVFLLTLFFVATTLFAQTPLPNLDARMPVAVAALAPEKTAALERLRQVMPSVKVELEPVSAAPKMVSASDGFLTGPNGSGATISAKNLASFVATDPHRVTKSFIQEHRALFGHGPEALATARVRRDDLTAHNGLHTMVWEQQVDGIALFESTLISHTTRKGELVSISSQFIADPEAAATLGTPDRASIVTTPIVSARQALALAARNVGEKIEAEALVPFGNTVPGAEQRQKFSASVFKGEADVKLIWLPMDKDTLRLCWDVVLMSKARGEMYRVLVDVRNGDVLLRRCLTSYISDASYRVWTSDSPSPFSPGWTTPTNLQPAIVARTLVTLPAMNTNASPEGWIPDGNNETLGNNVDAHTDWNNDDIADLPRPHGSPNRVFDFPIDLSTQDPTNYAAATVVQLFYLCNWYHDKLYELGFTESAGNFQSSNFGRGGADNDAVQADAQDSVLNDTIGHGSPTVHTPNFNNANFSTPADGQPGRMQMYIFNNPSPRRDGDFDAEIVFHEATHGLSGRLVGGGQALDNLQSGGMGEGWSDFYALALLSEPADNVNGNFAMGGYATLQLAGGAQNYYFGIRRYPYSTDMAKNPLTFKDIDSTQASTHSGIPRGPIGSSNGSEVHNQGEVWCVTLNEARVNLINKYGWAAGNQLMLQLATDGMKLTVPNPNFLQARDAILQADLVDTGGLNRYDLWTAFAKRGMGYSATSPSSSTTTGVQEAFDLPDNLHLLPGVGFTSSGGTAGPFSVTSQNYFLTNAGASTLGWTLINTSLWLNAAPTNGILPADGAAAVSISLNNVASNLAIGTYLSTVQLLNTTSSVAQTLTFTLTVLGAPVITKQPTNQIVIAGGAASFSATVIGVAPLTSQWRFNSTNLVNATNLTLALTGITTNQAGNYTLFVSNSFGAVTSSIALLTVLTPPANDACSGAIVIAVNNFTNAQSTTNATTGSDPSPTCVGGAFGKGVWYAFTPVVSGTLITDTLGSSFDTVLGIYSGSCGALTQIGCDDDSGSGVGGSSLVANSVTGGTTYLIQAGGWGAASGDLIFHLSFSTTNLYLQPIGLSNCVLNLSINGPATSNYVLQTSANLFNWTNILTNALSAIGSATFTDSNVCYRPTQFYRARFN